MLKNRNDLPPNGYVFFEPTTGWESPKYLGFEPAVSEIIAHRKANPRFKLPTDNATVEHELEQHTIARLQSMPGGDRWLIPGSPAPPPGSFIPPPSRRPVVGAARAVAASKADQIKTGVGTLLSWLGTGLKPVDAALAEKRGGICTTCPLNKAASTFSLSPAIGEAVKLMSQARGEMKLSTSHDDKLGTCAGCLCDLKTKIFVPIDTIWKNLKPEVVADLDPACWQILEKRD